MLKQARQSLNYWSVSMEKYFSVQTAAFNGSLCLYIMEQLLASWNLWCSYSSYMPVLLIFFNNEVNQIIFHLRLRPQAQQGARFLWTPCVILVNIQMKLGA